MYHQGVLYDDLAWYKCRFRSREAMSSSTIKTRVTIKLNQMGAVTIIGKLEDGKHNFMFSKVLVAC